VIAIAQSLGGEFSVQQRLEKWETGAYSIERCDVSSRRLRMFMTAVIVFVSQLCCDFALTLK
jgi:hypothetical protein